MPRKKSKKTKKKTLKKTTRRTSNKRRSYRRKRKFSLKRFLLKWLLIVFMWVSFGVILAVFYFAHDLPDISKLHEDITTPRITILSSDGQPIAKFGHLYGDYVHYNDIPKHLVHAVISAEDKRFFSHFGIDVLGIMRAAYKNYKAGRVIEGGSTITQQLAKVVFLSPERTFKRKVQELILALYLEKEFSKQDILSLYLNRIYFGGGNYGIDAAARSYYDKPTKDLGLIESAILAGIIKAPSRYALTHNAKGAEQRASYVLLNMMENGYLSEDHFLDVRVQTKPYAPPKNRKTISAPYFADWIYEQLSDYAGGIHQDLIITTTLDPKLQQLTETSLREHISLHGTKHKIGQGAIIFMSPNGAIRAMVGGKNYKNSQFNRVTQAYRQPGSAFKLFVYLAALNRNMTPNSIDIDEPITIGQWSPKNWDEQYQGRVTLEQAFANSINSVAVKTAQKASIRNVIDMASRLGINSSIEPNLSSALGSSEVNLLELTTAYAHIANQGQRVWPHGIEKITNKYGETIYERTKTHTPQILSTQIYRFMQHMLEQVIEYGTGKQAALPFKVAGKTGTSQGSKDAWFIGFSSSLVGGVWLGNDNNASMDKVSGGTHPAIIWKTIMQDAHKELGYSSIPITDTSETPSGLWDRIFNSTY